MAIIANYTYMQGVTAANSAFTFTHSLGFAPASMVARVMAANGALVTATAPLMVVTLLTNIVVIASGPGTLQTCVIEVQRIHSIIL